jgi:hypothetical protein
MTTATEATAEEIFDPEIHATDRKGNPSVNRDGSLRKKRRDAGAGRASGTRATTRTRATARAGGGSARDKHRRAVADFLALPAAGLSMVDPVMGYAATQVVPMWSDALADLAVERPQVAAVLERLGGVGAVGGVLSVALLTGVQFGYLTGKVPAHIARTMGCKSREEIEQILMADGQRIAQRSPEHARAEEPAGPVMAHA